MKLSIIIPAYNEQTTIEAIIRRVQAVNLGAVTKEILVVDDASRDDTPHILKSITGIVFLRHSVYFRDHRYLYYIHFLY